MVVVGWGGRDRRPSCCVGVVEVRVVGGGGGSLVIHMSKCHSITSYSVMIINQRKNVLFLQTKLPTETEIPLGRTATQYFDSQIYLTIEKQRE